MTGEPLPDGTLVPSQLVKSLIVRFVEEAEKPPPTPADLQSALPSGEEELERKLAKNNLGSPQEPAPIVQQQPSIIQSLGVHKCIDIAGGGDETDVIAYPIHKQDNQLSHVSVVQTPLSCVQKALPIMTTT